MRGPESDFLADFNAIRRRCARRAFAEVLTRALVTVTTVWAFAQIGLKAGEPPNAHGDNRIVATISAICVAIWIGVILYVAWRNRKDGKK